MPHHTCSCDDLCGLLGDPALLECPFFSACSQGLFTTPSSPQLQLPILGSERSWAGGKGKVGGDGSEEIEHSVLGLNGRVSPGASGCQMMDGVDTILHPPEHRAPAPCPQPPTPIPPSSLQSTFLHSGLGSPPPEQETAGPLCSPSA